MPDTGLPGIYNGLKRLNMELGQWKIKAADSGYRRREDDLAIWRSCDLKEDII
jgi:hypothetical protein